MLEFSSRSDVSLAIRLSRLNHLGHTSGD